MRRVATLLACLLLAGCGLGAGESTDGAGATLRITRDFGRETITTARQATVRESDTVMRLLQRNAKTTTRYGGRFVQSINGIAGEGSDGRRDWFYFVNGEEASVGAAERKLAPGDVVQWDYRRWDAAPRVPAIVGAFPEPFLHGKEGTRYPTRVECAPSTQSCDAVRKALQRAGVLSGSGSLGAEARGGVLRLTVGPWAELGDLQDLVLLRRGPRASGVFARFTPSGRLDLLDARGRVVRRAPPGSGLVAAIIPDEQQPLWIVTGVDDAGVARAAAALDTAELSGAYALAALPDGNERLPLPSAAP